MGDWSFHTPQAIACNNVFFTTCSEKPWLISETFFHLCLIGVLFSVLTWSLPLGVSLNVLEHLCLMPLISFPWWKLLTHSFLVWNPGRFSCPKLEQWLNWKLSIDDEGVWGLLSIPCLIKDHPDRRAPVSPGLTEDPPLRSSRRAPIQFPTGSDFSIYVSRCKTHYPVQLVPACGFSPFPCNLWISLFSLFWIKLVLSNCYSFPNPICYHLQFN